MLSGKTTLVYVSLLLAGLLLVAPAWSQPTTEAPAISLITDATPGPAASHGLAKLAVALRDKGIAFEKTNSIDTARERFC